MEQRPLRLGDIVDDYCPRERRITNHAIVAIVEDAIRQTRCTTCDAEHVYKEGREPRRRRKDPDPVLAGPAADADRPAPGAPAPVIPRAAAAVSDAPPAAPAEAAVEPEAPVAASAAAQPPAEDLWPAHRQLIRATLPRVDGEPPAPRPIPEFTMHQRQGRGGQGFRYAQGWNGNGPERGNGFRPNRQAHGNGNGNGRGHGNGNGPGPGYGQGPGNGGNGRPGGRRRRGRHKPPR